MIGGLHEVEEKEAVSKMPNVRKARRGPSNFEQARYEGKSNNIRPQGLTCAARRPTQRKTHASTAFCAHDASFAHSSMNFAHSSMNVFIAKQMRAAHLKSRVDHQ